jgi:hypothetical protein
MSSTTKADDNGKVPILKIKKLPWERKKLC